MRALALGSLSELFLRDVVRGLILGVVDGASAAAHHGGRHCSLSVSFAILGLLVSLISSQLLHPFSSELQLHEDVSHKLSGPASSL